MPLRTSALATLSILCWIGLATSVWAQESCRDARRIVGGEDTDIKDHPWQVALDVDGRLCGGVIIAQQWVLTSAHCFLPDYKAVRVKAGATNYKIGGVWTAAERVVLHSFNAETWENDLALV